MRIVERTASASILVVLSVLAGGCGGGGGSGSKGGAAPPILGQETDCSTLQWSVQDGRPGELVTLAGLPEAMGDISLQVMAEGAEGQQWVDPLFVLAGSGAGEASFRVPLHPSRDPEGGPVQLELGDGDQACPAQPFEILPLLEAANDYPDAVATTMEEWTDRVLEKLGYDPHTLLASDPDALSDFARLLRAVKYLVSSEDEGALPALAQEAREEQMQLTARLLKTIDLEGAIRQTLIALDDSSDGQLDVSGQSPGGASRLMRTGSQNAASLSASAQYLTPRSGGCLVLEPDKLQIASAAELSERMLAARQGNLLFDHPGPGQVLGGISLADTLGVVDAGRAAPVSDFLGTGLFVISTLEAAKQALERKRPANPSTRRHFPQ